MADGRILSKRVTRSDKIASLSSDTSRMIYSWLIPYLDVEGRIEADPRLLKADIAPLLDHITPKIISDILDELNSIGLIILYEVEKKKYLQLVKFEENQKNLRKDREAPSRIPEPKEGLRINSGLTPVEVPHNIREEKLSLREENKKAGAGNLDQPVDNSPTEKDCLLKEKDKTAISELIQKIFELNYTKEMQKGVTMFIRQYYPDNNSNPDAIYHCLNRIFEKLSKGETVEYPFKFLEHIFKTENGNYNERDYQAAIKTKGMATAGDLMKAIGMKG